MKQGLIYIFILFVSITNINASEYSDWLASQNQEYTQFKKSYDDEFSNMLKKQWEEYKTYNTPSAFNKPKPKTLPTVQEVVKVPQKDIKKSVIVNVPENIVKEKVKPKQIVKQDYKDGYTNIKFDFYNQPINIQYDDKFKFDLFEVNKNTISKSWQTLSSTNYNDIINQIDKYNNRYSFNDWAKYLFIYNIGQNIYTNNNQANLFTWFILTKMKYDTKVAYSNDEVYLLANVKQKLYQVSYFTIDNKRYNVLNPKGNGSSMDSVFTYESNYKDANNVMSFDMTHKEIALYSNIQEKSFSFDYENKQYNLKAKYSFDLVKFYETFPQSEYSLYYDSKKSNIITSSLLVQLKPFLANKTELEATNFLLRFVQKAFKYKTDDEQFSYEKVLFPEETLYYPYCDCEDRSIIFVYLVKELLGLDAVGILYSDHMSAGVSFSTNVSGDSILYDNKTYIISDPTYINANVGMSMPKYKNSKYTIVK
jgi:hypothetical protein